MSQSVPSNRLIGIDAMRFIAACGVVWIHTTEVLGGTIWARWAVPFFTIISVWLMGQSLSRKPDVLWSRYAVRRALRLYGTFLIWTAIYLAARALKHAVFHRGDPIMFDPALFWAGPAEQLWFLPFLCVASIAVFPLCKAAVLNPFAAGIIFVGSIGLAMASAVMPLSFPFELSKGNGYFLYTSYGTLPALFAGVAMVAGERWLGRALRTRMAAIIGAAILIGTQIVLFRTDRHAGLEAIAGVGAMMMALWPGSGKLIRSVAAAGVYAFGIYIVHVLFVELLQALFSRVTKPSAWEDVFVAVVSIVLSIGVSRVLQRTPLIPA